MVMIILCVNQGISDGRLREPIPTSIGHFREVYLSHLQNYI